MVIFIKGLARISTHAIQVTITSLSQRQIVEIVSKKREEDSQEGDERVVK